MSNLLKAAHFAALKHSTQKRKNVTETPYINHPIEVAEHLARVGNVADEAILIAALLHDTIEDTETTREEISQIFGETVAGLVMECSDDKSLEKAERKRLQIIHAPGKSSGAKMIKIADKTCNLKSIRDDPPKEWSSERRREYFVWAQQVVNGLLGENEALDQYAKEVITDGLKKLSL